MVKAFRESSIGTRSGKVPMWECLLVHRETGLVLSLYVDEKIGWEETQH